MPSTVGKLGIWIKENLSEIAAVVVILSGIGGFISHLNPLIWQTATILLLLLGAYEVGYWRGEHSVRATRSDDGTPEWADEAVESDEDLVARALDRIDGWFVIREGGDIVLEPDEDLHIGREGMLYVLVARAAYDAGERDSPRVNQLELANKTEMMEKFVSYFVKSMDGFIERHYDPDMDLSEVHADDIEFELNVSEVLEAVKYIRGEREAPN